MVNHAEKALKDDDPWSLSGHCLSAPVGMILNAKPLFCRKKRCCRRKNDAGKATECHFTMYNLVLAIRKIAHVPSATSTFDRLVEHILAYQGQFPSKWTSPGKSTKTHGEDQDAMERHVKCRPCLILHMGTEKWYLWMLPTYHGYQTEIHHNSSPSPSRSTYSKISLNVSRPLSFLSSSITTKR